MRTFEENISGIRVAQSLAVEHRNIKSFQQVSQDNFNLQMKSTNLFAAMSAIVSINAFVVMILMIGFGGYRFVIGGIEIGILIAFVQYANQFVAPVQDLTMLSNMLLDAGAALVHIRKGMNVTGLILDPDSPNPLPSEVGGKIDLNHVLFRYSEDIPLFEDLNIHVASHEKVGIVGETGAGKTTLINLITRLYDVKEGFHNN